MSEKERRILIRRFFWRDRDIYNLGKNCGIEWFDKYDAKFTKDRYAYFADDERREAIDRIVKETSDEKFIEALNRVGYPDYIEIDRFIGERYYFDKKEGFKVADRRDLLRNDVRRALNETGERGYYALKAIIELYKEGRWDRAYGGATWVDILSKVRELGGEYPSPRDIVILKSYGIYYKTGSRRYPTHTIPEEMIPTIEEELEKWKANRLKSTG
jgi:hypothetical protein